MDAPRFRTWPGRAWPRGVSSAALVVGLAAQARAQTAAPAVPEPALLDREAAEQQAVDGEAGDRGAVEPGGAEPRVQGRAGSVAFLEKLAKQRFNQSVLEQNAALLAQALDALELGMTLSDAPGFVFNAGLVQQRLGHCAEAEELYRHFLTIHPTSPRRTRVEHQLQQLESCVDADPERARWVLPGLVPEWYVPSVGPSTRERAIAWAELEAAPASPGLDGDRILVWSLAGGAAVSAALASVSFVQAWSADAELDELNVMDSDAGERATELEEQGERAQTRARAFGVVAGGLGIAAGVGFWLLSKGSEQGPERASSEVVLDLGPDRLGAGWVGQF